MAQFAVLPIFIFLVLCQALHSGPDPTNAALISSGSKHFKPHITESAALTALKRQATSSEDWREWCGTYVGRTKGVFCTKPGKCAISSSIMGCYIAPGSSAFLAGCIDFSDASSCGNDCGTTAEVWYGMECLRLFGSFG